VTGGEIAGAPPLGLAIKAGADPRHNPCCRFQLGRHRPDIFSPGHAVFHLENVGAPEALARHQKAHGFENVRLSGAIGPRQDDPPRRFRIRPLKIQAHGFITAELAYIYLVQR
jgi:hypothetical protein